MQSCLLHSSPNNEQLRKQKRGHKGCTYTQTKVDNSRICNKQFRTGALGVTIAEKIYWLSRRRPQVGHHKDEYDKHHIIIMGYGTDHRLSIKATWACPYMLLGTVARCLRLVITGCTPGYGDNGIAVEHRNHTYNIEQQMDEG